VVLIDGGRTVRLGEAGVLEADGLVPAEYIPLVTSALSTGQLSVRSELLRGLGSQTRSPSEADAFHLIAPVGVVSISDRPVFRWQRVKGAQGYSVVVRDVASDHEVQSEALSKAEWKPGRGLRRGQTYSWVVIATLGDDKRLYVPGAGSPAAMFKVLDRSASEELEKARTKPDRSHMLMAVLYARHGLVTEAQNELNALERENPHSAIVARLRLSLKSDLRR
jgi:hypothetical protein